SVHPKPCSNSSTIPVVTLVAIAIHKHWFVQASMGSQTCEGVGVHRREGTGRERACRANQKHSALLGPVGRVLIARSPKGAQMSISGDGAGPAFTGRIGR